MHVVPFFQTRIQIHETSGALGWKRTRTSGGRNMCFAQTINTQRCLFSIITIHVFYLFRLEYKYMKLVAPSDGKEVELPAAETCALSEEDEEEEFDAVRFTESKGNKFFNKIKSIGGKKVNFLLQAKIVLMKIILIDNGLTDSKGNKNKIKSIGGEKR